MKKVLVRKGVFETNSSSSHSISIADDTKQFVMDTIYPNQHGVVEVSGDEFGWEWFKHNDAITKASYVAQQFSNNDSALETLNEVIKEHTGADEVKFVNLENGYVDHESYGIVPQDKESLKNFIFNKNSWLFGGNDNSGPDPTFYDVPEFRDGRIVVPEYKYELSIDGFEKTTKFKTEPTEEDIEQGVNALMSHGTLLTSDGSFIVEDSIMWQITRPRHFYELSYHIEQDFSKNQIIFLKEDSYGKIHKIEDELRSSGKLEGLNYNEKCKLTTEEIIKVPGLTKIVKFHVTEI